MYHQINPTELFRERHLALLEEAEDRRLARQLRARRKPKVRGKIAAVLGLLVALVLVAGIMLAASSRPAHASTTFTVDDDFVDFADLNPGDGVCDVNLGANEETCTLRAAIQEANLAPGADTINFNITRSSDGIATISPKSALPNITDRVTIDGYSQPGASPNTLAQGTNAVLKVELDGSKAGSANGLFILAGGSGSVIKGLAINRFGVDGVAILGNISSSLGSDQNRIEGNFIGTDLGGTFDLGNGGNGVGIFAPSSVNTIGGSSPAARNLISGNGGKGVDIIGNSLRPGTASLNRVEGNLIGTRKDGTTALGNVGDGVEISSTSNNTVSSNTIAFNGKDGVRVSETLDSNVSNGNLLFGNSIFSNVEQGIDLNADGVTPNDPLDADVGPNTLQNKPLLTSARTSRKATTIKGTLNSTPNKGFTVQLFSNASGDEGQRFIGQTSVTSDSSGNASFTFKPALKVRKGKITATTSDLASRNTSEFSAAKKVVVVRRR